MRMVIGILGSAFVLACCQGAEEIEADARGELHRLQEDVAARSSAQLPMLEGEAEVEAEIDRLLAAPLDFASALQVALLNQRGLRARYEELGVARAELFQARLLENPSLSIDLMVFDAGTEVEGALVQSLLSLFTRPQREALSAARYRMLRADLGAELVGAIYEIRRRWVAMRGAEERVRLASEELAVLVSRRELIDALDSAGNLPELVALRAAEVEARARLMLAEAEVSRETARCDFDEVLGVWGERCGWTLDANQAFVLRRTALSE